MEADEFQQLSVDLVLEFPGATMTSAGLALLADIMDGGRVLDLVFIHKELDESIRKIDVSGLVDEVDLDLAVLVGARPGALGAAEIAAAGAHIDAGSSAAILMFEHVPDSPVVVDERLWTPAIVAGTTPVAASAANGASHRWPEKAESFG
jgi:hypothetical protein